MKNGQTDKQQNTIKSKAKVIGLKSAFVIDDGESFLDTFGQGNEAVPEKYIVREQVTDIRNNFSAKVPKSNCLIEISDGKFNTSVDPRSGSANQLHAKDAVEKLHFGTSFDDNVHVQLAYNIMDVKKVLSFYANYAITAVNGLFFRSSEDKTKDYLGTFPANNDVAGARLAHKVIMHGLLIKKAGSGGEYDVDYKVWNEKKNKELSGLAKKVNDYIEANKKLYASLIDNKNSPEKVERHFILKYLKEAGSWKDNSGSYSYNCAKKAAESYERSKALLNSAVYFTDAFPSDKDSDVYTVIALLGKLRQSNVHGSINPNWIYKIEQDANANERETLNTLLEEKLKKINDDFVKKNAKNLFILFEAFPDDDRNALAQGYYDFAVRKNYKNLGFSVTTLRETIMAQVTDIHWDEYQTVQNKLNSLLDFMIYRYYADHAEKQAYLVKGLRALEDRVQKPAMYEKAAREVWNAIKGNFHNTVLPHLDDIRSDKTDGLTLQETEILVQDLIRPEEIGLFSKAIYLMSLFLDSKEVNMFLTSLISKFSNIASLLNVIDYLKDTYPSFKNQALLDEYALFRESGRIEQELTLIKSIAQMSKGKMAKKTQTAKIKECHYLDAAAVLGETDKEKVARLFCLNDQNATKEAHSFRNFITSTVIRSKRFEYVARLMDPKAASRIMKNEPLVSLALESIPESQLVRYCDSEGITFDDANPDYEEMRNELCKRLLKLHFDDFTGVDQSAAQDTPEAKEKERCAARIRLYLTCLYFVVKNLVRINTKYFIAFCALERDMEIMNAKYDTDSFYFERWDSEKKRYVSNPRCIKNHFEKEGWLNAKAKKYCDKNKDLFTAERFKVYRNQVVHLGVIFYFPEYIDEIVNAENYYDLYHYIMYCLIRDKAKDSEKLKTYPCKNGLTLDENERTYNNACADLVSALNIPFAYNAARYINLSDKKLFLRGFAE